MSADQSDESNFSIWSLEEEETEPNSYASSRSLIMSGVSGFSDDFDSTYDPTTHATPDFDSNDSASITSYADDSPNHSDQSNVDGNEMEHNVDDNSNADVNDISQNENYDSNSNVGITTENNVVDSDEPPPKMARLDLDQSDQEANHNCTICFEAWTNSGEHRLICLKCGHLFGHSCITRWLRQPQNKSCPTCKAKANIKDIRFIYPAHISYVDNSETEAVKAELERVNIEKNRLTIEIDKLTATNAVHLNTIQRLEFTLQQLVSNQARVQPALSSSSYRFFTKSNLIISKDNDSCRVLAYSKNNNSLCTSQMSTNHLFGGYGVRWINYETNAINKLIILHSKEIRGLVYSQANNLMLSASLDKTIKLLDSNQVTDTIETEMPLWSCCWDHEQPHRLYAGTSNGVVLQYDIRQTRCSLAKMDPESDLSPVISLAAPPGGVISCQLNSIKTFRRREGNNFTPYQPLPLSGPFTNLNYDPFSNHIVVSTRPNAKVDYCQHALCYVDLNGKNSSAFNVVHTFQGSKTQTLISKTSQFSVGTDHLFAAHNEEQKSIDIWNVNKGIKKASLATCSVVIDTVPWVYSNDVFLGALSKNKVTIYKVSHD